MTHALVLLCGGLSTRMGTNKAFLLSENIPDGISSSAFSPLL